MSVRELISELETRVTDESYPGLKKWKEENPGSKIAGCFPVYSPVEMVHACGMLPALIAGSGKPIDLGLARGHLQAFICSIGHSTLELKLRGNLDEIDCMIFPSICEISRGLSNIWQRLDPKTPAIYLHFPQNIESAHAVEYLTHELGRLQNLLEEVSGNKITADSLNKSFQVYNKRADAIAKLDDLRNSNPQALSARDFYVLCQAGMTIPPEEHTELLNKAFEMASESIYEEPRFKMLLTGTFCARPPLSLLENIENAGIAIVDDDVLLGQRWWIEPLPITEDPIRALASHYVSKAVSSSVVYAPPGERCGKLHDLFKSSGADGILIAPAKFCYPAKHDLTCIVKTCESEGIPYILIEYEENMTEFHRILLQIESLLEARSKLPFAGTEKE